VNYLIHYSCTAAATLRPPLTDGFAANHAENGSFMAPKAAAPDVFQYRFLTGAARNGCGRSMGAHERRHLPQCYLHR
jgi:hypothetical protein